MALDHREPDRVPVDLGGLDAAGINALAYIRLNRYLKLEYGPVKVDRPYQLMAHVEKGVLEWMHGDVVPVLREPREWREGNLPDGTPALFPALWKPESQSDGAETVRNGRGDAIAKRVENSWFFEPLGSPLSGADTVKDVEEWAREKRLLNLSFYADEDWKSFKARARSLHEETEFFLVGNFGAQVYASAQRLQGYATFMENLLLCPEVADAVMNILVDESVRQFLGFAEAVGRYVDVMSVADDLGTQRAPQISPDLYRKRIKPFHKRLYAEMHRVWPGKILLHSDGAIAPLIPDLIDAGVDILNPIQPTTSGMDPLVLKREFGHEICFWGGGCDTQHVLPFGSPEEVREDVKRRLEALMPGGGFVFSQVHNILPDVPPANIEAMYEAVKDYGIY